MQEIRIKKRISNGKITAISVDRRAVIGMYNDLKMLKKKGRWKGVAEGIREQLRLLEEAKVHPDIFQFLVDLISSIFSNILMF